MAIAATLTGAIFGFASFLISLLALGHSFAASCGIYFATGFLTTALIVIASSLPRRPRADNQIGEGLTAARAG